MPEARAANWSTIRFKCTGLLVPAPGILRVSLEERDIECDESLLDHDSVGLRVLALNGSDLSLRSDRLPVHLRRPGSIFWLAIDNAGRWLYFLNEEDTEPAVVLPEDVAVPVRHS